MSDQESVTVLDGNTFVVSQASGDIEASPADPSGLFAYDTRFLSKWVLTVNGERVHPLSVDDVHYFEARFFVVPGEATVYVDAKVSIIRERRMQHGFDENLVIFNHGEDPVDITVRIDAGCDFADIFDVKDALGKKGEHYIRVEDDCLLLGYRRGTFRRETVITVDAAAQFDDHGFTLSCRIAPRERWMTRLRVEAVIVLPASDANVLPHWRQGHETMQRNLDVLLSEAPVLECNWQPLKDTYRRSLVDLAALRFAPRIAHLKSLPAAGLPWFMTIFGRDSIFTSLQALPFDPEISATTLRVLAEMQGVRRNDHRDEDPGRILHEVRYGESMAFDERPHSPYYGNADATALFVILLDEYERWSGDVGLVAEVENEARAALNWIDEYADLTGRGYVYYQRRNEETGLENQCWKDSWDSISYHDGHLPGFPRATCELQGYAYDAKIRGARLARQFWGDPAYADRLEREAAELKARFNRDFWVADRNFFALALDADGGQVDAMSSNMGHLLWSGIVDDAKADAVVAHLMGPKMFTGWGIRTLGEDEGRYNPVGYHVGTVWPFDNSFIAWGMRRYGYENEAARIAAGILDAAQFFNGRLPEAFGGYERTLTRYPVQYPTACSPQAWSAGAPLLFLRTLLGLEPSGENLVVNPALPPGINHIELIDIRGRWGHADAFARERDGLGKQQTIHPQLGDPFPEQEPPTHTAPA